MPNYTWAIRMRHFPAASKLVLRHSTLKSFKKTIFKIQNYHPIKTELHWLQWLLPAKDYALACWCRILLAFRSENLRLETIAWGCELILRLYEYTRTVETSKNYGRGGIVLSTCARTSTSNDLWTCASERLKLARQPLRSSEQKVAGLYRRLCALNEQSYKVKISNHY